MADDNETILTEQRDETRQRRVLAWALSLVGLLSVGVAYRSLVDYDPSAGANLRAQGAERFLFAPTGSSPGLIIGLTALFLFARRKHLVQYLGTPGNPLPGLLLLGGSTALVAWSHYVGSPDLLIPALAQLLLGTAWLLGSWTSARLVVIPALFVLLAVTPPAAFVNQLVFPLQLVTAELSTAILNAIGTPASAEGEMILTHGHSFQVIETCSGWRSMQTLLMAAFVYGEMFYLGRRRYLALIGFSVPLAFLLNQIRVVTIVLNPLSRFAEIHTLQGIATTVVGVLLLALIDTGLGRWLGPGTRPEWARHVAAGTRHRLPLGRLTIVASALVLAAVATRAISPWAPPPVQRGALSSLPAQIGGLKTQSLKLEREYLGSVNPGEWVYRSYFEPDRSQDERSETAVRVFLAANERLSRNRSLLSDKTKLPGPSSIITERTVLNIPGLASEVEVLRVRWQLRDRLIVYWREGTRSVTEETLRAWAGLDRSFLSRPGRAVVVRLETDIAPGSANGLPAAYDRIFDLAVPVAGFVRRLLDADATASANVR